MLGRQGELHPDRYGGSEGELAKELSGRVNGAYAVLSDPVKRVEYIVSRLVRVFSSPLLLLRGRRQKGLLWDNHTPIGHRSTSALPPILNEP